MMGTECVVPLSVENIKLNSMGLEVNGHVETCDGLDESTCGNDVNELADIRMNSDEEESSPISSNIVNGDHRRGGWRYKKRGEMTPTELALARERDRVQSRRRREKAELLRLENLKEHEIKVEDATHSSPIAMLDECCSQKEIDSEKTNYDSSTSASSTTQRRRIVKKRNRSDMNPEELARLRERERKAQQNRRDRMRAQKRQASGWHDEDAAWEAFLNEADEPVSKGHSPSSHVPSMVCDPDEKQFLPPKNMPEAPPDQASVGLRTVVQIESDAVQSFAASAPGVSESEKHCYSSEASPQAEDVDAGHVDTASHSSPDSPNNLSLMYSSDENSKDGSFKDDQAAGKKCGRRHYLPTDELERIRKRERDAKRKQREKARLLTSEKLMAGGAASFLPSEAQASSRYHAVSPIGSRTDIDVKVRACQSSKIERAACVDRTNSDAEVPDHRLVDVSTSGRSGMCVGHNEGRYEGSSSPTKANEPSVSHKEHFRHINYSIPRHALSSHDFREHPEVMLASPHSRATVHVVPPHAPHHSPHHVYQPFVYLSPEVKPIPYGHGVSAFPHMESVKKASPTSRCSSPQPTSASEKKRLISRNVDRKKLSEDELEELRRRERDYQRERRARIRMEKANAQVSSEKQATVKHSSDDEDKASFYLSDAAFMPRVIHHRQHPGKDYAAQPSTSNHPLPQDKQFPSSHHQCQGSSSESLQSLEPWRRAEKGDLREEVSCSSINGVAQLRLHLPYETGLEDTKRDRATYLSQDKEANMEITYERNELPSRKAEKWRSSSSDIECRLNKTSVFSSESAMPHAPGSREASKKAKKNILEHICSSLKGLDDPPSDARFEAPSPGVFREESPSKNADEHPDEDDDEERLVIVQPNIEESMRDDGKRFESDKTLEGDHRLSVLKEELMKDIKDEPSSTSSSQAEEQLSEDKWRYWKEGLTEDQLERRRKSNREAQRRRRARLRMQGHSGDESSYYDSVIDAHGLKQEPTYVPTAGVNVPASATKRPGSAVDEFQDRRNMSNFDMEIEKFKLRPEVGNAYKSVCGSPSLEGDARTGRAKGCRVKLTPSLRGGDVGFDERYPSREDETHVGRYAYAEPFTRPYVMGGHHSHYYSSALQRTAPQHKVHHGFYYPDHHPSYHGDYDPLHHLQGYYYPEMYHRHHHHNYHEKLAQRPIPMYRHERECRDRDRYELIEDGHYSHREVNHGFRKVHQRVRSPLDYPEEKEAVPQIKSECRPRARSPMSDQASANKSLPHSEDTSTSKQCGRKRKQFVPRRVMSTTQSFSAAHSSDEDDRAAACETRRVPELREEADRSGSGFHQRPGRGVSSKFRALDPNDNRMEAHHYDDCVQVVGGD